MNSAGNETFCLYDEILPGVGAFSIKPSIGVLGENELKSFIVSLIECKEANNSRLNRLKYYTEMILSEPSMFRGQSVKSGSEPMKKGDMYVMGYIRADSKNDYYYFLKENGFLHTGSEFLFYFYAIKGKDVYSHHKDIFRSTHFRFYINQIHETNTYMLEPAVCRIVSNELISKSELVNNLRNMGFDTDEDNRIEGIYTTDKRLEELVSQKAEPRNRSEQEISGYREVLSTIHESYEYIVPRPNIILQLHRDLYSYAGSGGEYKNADNVIAETDAEGHQRARFIPVPAFQTAEAMDELCRQFLEAWNTDKIDRLLLIPMFILDFLCIHPFNDGNGRMSRLLSLLLYYKAGYIVGKYVSMEMLIEKTKETYYEALQASSTGWHENENSYEPFLKYYLGITLKAYNEFESRVEHLKNRTLSKPERIKAMIDQKVGKITKKEIMDAYPDISKTTVERTLADLVKSEYIAKVGSGPATGYVKI